MAIKMGFGVFTMIPMWWSIRPGQHFWCLPVSKTRFQRVARSFEVLQVPQKNSFMSRNVGEPSLGLGTMSQGDTKVPPGSTAGNQPHYHPSQLVSSLCYHPAWWYWRWPARETAVFPTWLGGSEAALPGELLYPRPGWVVAKLPCPVGRCLLHVAGW
jgi:hypothetical protein